jgi:1-acyl-sn-glycerol-3-phosphate acyltransferase
VILVPAEGTRKRVEKWRTGFYRIALEAKVPISLGYLDYKKKEAGTLGAFWPSGDFQKDMDYIADQYRDIVPKFPEKYNTKIY